MPYDAKTPLDFAWGLSREGSVLRIDGSYMYGVGAALNDLKKLRQNSKTAAAGYALFVASNLLDGLLHKSVFHLKTSRQSGEALLKAVKEAGEYLSAGLNNSPPEDRELGWRYFGISAALETFEAVLRAELALADLYLVTVKGGYDTNALIERGEALFPSDLVQKVPETLLDCRSAGRCIAFELPTAAAFHIHRANEIVLRAYYNAVTGGKPHPEKRQVTAYIDAIKNHLGDKRDKKVLAALASLNSLHRNPVAHADAILENIEDAIALLGSVHAAMIHMLKALKPAPLVLTPPPSSASEAITNESKEK